MIITIEIRDKKLKRLFKKDAFIKTVNYRLSHEFLGFGSYAVNKVKREIRAGGSYFHLGVQRYIKGSDRFFIHTGGYLDSITYKVVRRGIPIDGIDVGALNGNSPAGLPYKKVSKILNEGTPFVPTPAQRAAVAIKADMAGAPPPDGSGAKPFWNIPARPHLAKALDNNETREVFVNHCMRAVHKALNEYSK